LEPPMLRADERAFALDALPASSSGCPAASSARFTSLDRTRLSDRCFDRPW
jgi:hypothetical protein